MNTIFICFFIILIIIIITICTYIILKSTHDKQNLETNFEIEINFFHLFKFKIKSSQTKHNKINTKNK